MPVDYSQFVGMEYRPPFGCFYFVQHVFAKAYGIHLPEYAEGLNERDLDARAQRFQEHLTENCVKVDDPREGDAILINRGGRPFHIGLVIGPGEMIHAYSGGQSSIESYESIHWRSRIEGFYRYVKG